MTAPGKTWAPNSRAAEGGALMGAPAIWRPSSRPPGRPMAMPRPSARDNGADVPPIPLCRNSRLTSSGRPLGRSLMQAQESGSFGKNRTGPVNRRFLDSSPSAATISFTKACRARVGDVLQARAARLPNAASPRSPARPCRRGQTIENRARSRATGACPRLAEHRKGRLPGRGGRSSPQCSVSRHPIPR